MYPTSSVHVEVMYKTSHLDVLRHSRAAKAKKCTTKCDARAEILLWLLIQLLF